MSKNIQQIQRFRTIDLILVVVMVASVSAVFGATLAETFRDDRSQQAQVTAEALAREIYNRHLYKAGEGSSQRGPASIERPLLLSSGKVGKDPWGRPYHYLIRQSESEPMSYFVIVWSIGPNGVPETNPEELTSHAEANSAFAARGDDLGHFERLSIDL